MSDSQRKQYPTRGVNNQPLNWSLTTTSATANQSVGSRIIANGTKYCIQAIIIEVYLSTLSETAALLGDIQLNFGGAAVLGAFKASNTNSGAMFGLIIPLPEEYVVIGDGSKTLEAVCTPAGITSTVWKMTIIGYERS